MHIFKDIEIGLFRAETSATVTAFTYFGPQSSPYQRACLLMSSCEVTSSCTDCFTEVVSRSSTDCLCAVPRECYVNHQNVIGVIDGTIPYQEVFTKIFSSYSSFNHELFSSVARYAMIQITALCISIMI